MIKQDRGTGTGSRRPILRIREPPSSAFIRGYRAKQWQNNPRDLDAEMIGFRSLQLPTTATFSDTFQGLPTHGYAALLWRMADPR